MFGNNDSELFDEPVLTPENLPEVEEPAESLPEESTIFDGVASSQDSDRNELTYSLSNRDVGSRETALRSGGGDATTEAAVLRGLKWLVRNQHKTGYWSLLGPYSGGIQRARDENRPAATAMALLAFQGHGETRERGEFRAVVQKGWDWLLAQQDSEGCFYREGEGAKDQRFYTQGLCTIAICELFAMTRDADEKEKLRPLAQAAVDYCVNNQRRTGGWKYYLNSDWSDVSVTGWILMGLQSAKMAGLNVPTTTLDQVSEFLDSVALEGGSRYPYEIGRQPTRSMTAEALLCRQYLGWKRDDPRLIDGIQWLTEPGNLVDFKGKDESGLSNRDVYYWYYATQVLHHFRGSAWKTWNDRMKQAMCENQVADGPEGGSWDPQFPTPDRWSAEGGRLYVSCLSICILEVYYRHLPIYRAVTE